MDEPVRSRRPLVQTAPTPGTARSASSSPPKSYRQFATGYYLRRDGMQWSWDQYTTDPTQRAESTASPLRASLEQLAGLPPALVITAQADVVRDEGEAYADKLREAGVPATTDRFPAIIHDFVMLNASPTPTPPGAPSPWPPTPYERRCPTSPEAPASRGPPTIGQGQKCRRRPSPDQAHRR